MRLVSAYTLSGRSGASSLTGTCSGVPYTEHDEENTMFRTSDRCSASIRRWEPATLLAK